MQTSNPMQVFEQLPVALQEQALLFMKLLLQQHELLKSIQNQPKNDWQTAERFFRAIKIDSKNFRFDREEANER